MRSPGWAPARSHELFTQGELALLVAEYEQTFVPFDGNPRRFRRFGLVRRVAWPQAEGEPGQGAEGARWTVVDAVTILLTSTGANPSFEERRDIDGDHVPDIIVHYAKMPGPDEQQELGLVALSSRDARLSRVPLSHVLSPETGKWASACWAWVDDRDALLVKFDGAKPTPSAYVWTEYGLRPRPIFAAVLATGADEAVIIKGLPAAPASGDDDTRKAVVPPDCHVAPGYVVRRVAEAEYELLGGFSMTPATVRGSRTSTSERVVRLDPEESLVWPTTPALN